jgi:hypothetical protein
LHSSGRANAAWKVELKETDAEKTEDSVVRRSIATLTALMATSLAAPVPAPAQAQTPASPVSEQQTKMLNLTAYAELLRNDVQAQKIAILTEVMGFTEAEDKAFWPIYRDYNTEMATLGDERVALISEYTRAYTHITDDVARSLATRAMDLDKRRNAALERCFTRVGTALSPRMALKFLEVEHQLLLIIDLQISASLPIVK